MLGSTANANLRCQTYVEKNCNLYIAYIKETTQIYEVPMKHFRDKFSF